MASTGRKDPSLNKGGIYLVEQESFCKHVKEYGFCVPYDPSDCNQHDVVQSATRCRAQGLVTSGIATVDCAQHDCKNPASVTILDVSKE